MIQASIAAFLGSYFSVFYAPRIDLFLGIFLLLLIGVVLKTQFHQRFILTGISFFIWTSCAVQWQLDSRYDIAKKTTVILDLELIQLPANKMNSVRFLAKPLRVVEANDDFDYLKLNKIRVNWYQSDQILKGGQIWRMKIRLQPPHGYQNKGGFDYERWMFVEGISATAYVVNSFKPLLIGESNNVILKIRSWLSGKIQQHAKGLTYLALFQTLSIGDKTLLLPDLKTLFVNTGTAHLLVISGLHVGLLSLMFYLLASRAWVFINHRFKSKLNQSDFAVYWAWGAAFIYSALAGFSLPTLRALLMLSILYISILRRQKTPVLNVFSTALMLILLLQPLALLSFSFWLSFLAVMLIVLSQYLLQSVSKLKAMLLLQLMFSILFIPLNAVVFNQFVLSSFFANLILIPAMSFVVIPLNLLVTFLSALDWSGSFLLYQFLDVLIGYLVQYLNFLGDVFNRPIALSDHSLWMMVVSAGGALLLFLIKQPRVKFPALLIMLLPWFYWQDELKPREFMVNVFDIGMGTSVLIKTQKHTLLYDLGPGNKTSYQPAKWVIKPYLNAIEIDNLDKIVVSHSDQDHYGGVWALIKEGLISDTIVTGSKWKMQWLLGRDINLKNCHDIKPWVWDGVTFKFLPLRSTLLQSDNNHSCVLKVYSEHGSVLLTGDIEKEREAELLKYHLSELKTDILLVPHHGSKTSSTESFIEAVGPQYAVVTTGYLNHWGFPKKLIKARYDQLKVEWFNTGVDGAVLFNINAKGIKVSSFRNNNDQLWY